MNSTELQSLDEALYYLNEGKVLDTIKTAVEKFKKVVKKFIDKVKEFLKSMKNTAVNKILDAANKLFKKEITGEKELNDSIEALKNLQGEFEIQQYISTYRRSLYNVIFSYKNKHKKIYLVVKKYIDEFYKELKNLENRNNITVKRYYLGSNILEKRQLIKDKNDWNEDLFDAIHEQFVNAATAIGSMEDFLYAAEVHDYVF